MTDRVIFLPGASGDGSFWAPVASRLPYPLDKVVLDWPGFGSAPRDPDVRGLQDLVTFVLRRVDDRTDLTPLIPSIRSPTLLIWGDADPISPPAVGEYLARLLPRSRLVIIRGGEHMLGRDRPDDVAPLIANHLAVEPG